MFTAISAEGPVQQPEDRDHGRARIWSHRCSRARTSFRNTGGTEESLKLWRPRPHDGHTGFCVFRRIAGADAVTAGTVPFRILSGRTGPALPASAWTTPVFKLVRGLYRRKKVTLPRSRGAAEARPRLRKRARTASAAGTTPSVKTAAKMNLRRAGMQARAAHPGRLRPADRASARWSQPRRDLQARSHGPGTGRARKGRSGLGWSKAHWHWTIAGRAGPRKSRGTRTADRSRRGARRPGVAWPSSWGRG